MQKTYPQLKAYALQRNCELRVYDLSYPPISTAAAAAGASSALDDHSQTAIPARLLESLQRNADNFVFLVKENALIRRRQLNTISGIIFLNEQPRSPNTKASIHSISF